MLLKNYLFVYCVSLLLLILRETIKIISIDYNKIYIIQRLFHFVYTIYGLLIFITFFFYLRIFCETGLFSFFNNLENTCDLEFHHFQHAYSKIWKMNTGYYNKYVLRYVSLHWTDF